MKNFKIHMKNVLDALHYAEQKHPIFAQGISKENPKYWEVLEVDAKHNNEMNFATNNPICADEILNEEVAEAFNSAMHGDKENAIHEFYQVAAVALRCIELLEE